MAYKITGECLKCGVCVPGCPTGAIVVENRLVEKDGLVLFTTRIESERCTDCGVCVSEEYWCPAQAIVKA